MLLLVTIQYFKCNFMWNLVPLWKSYRWTGQTQKSTWQIYYKSVVAAANDKKTSWEPVKHYDFLPLLLKQELWISWTCAILSYSAKLTNFQLLLRFLTFYVFDSDNTTLSLHFKKQLGIYSLIKYIYWNLTNFAPGII